MTRRKVQRRRRPTTPAMSMCAVGTMGRNAEGREAMLTVTLRPEVRFSGATLPTPAEIAQMHHKAHDECFIANSVKTEVRCEPVGA